MAHSRWEQIENYDAFKNIQGIVFGAALGAYFGSMCSSVNDAYSAVIFLLLLVLYSCTGFACHYINLPKIRMALIPVTIVYIFLVNRFFDIPIADQTNPWVYGAITGAWWLLSFLIERQHSQAMKDSA